MTERSAHVLRALTFLAFGIAGVLGLRLCLFSDTESRLTTAEADRGEVTVLEALSLAADESHVVRGFLFYDDGRGMRLCSFRENADPPECQEPFVDLIGVDQSHFNLESGYDKRLKLKVYWSEETVAVVGTIKGRELTVEQVVR